ncbi:MAG: hypothetical protein AAF497_22130 [Planctomycetota bacterium]
MTIWRSSRQQSQSKARRQLALEPLDQRVLLDASGLAFPEVVRDDATNEIYGSRVGPAEHLSNELVIVIGA